MSKNRLTIRKDKPDKELYQTRARAILPVLVRQARASQEITYKDLGTELGLHHRVLRHSLDCIGETLCELSREWRESGESQENIPPIQGIVVNQTTRLPGNGVNFLRHGEMESWRKKAVVAAKWEEIFAYPKWLDVLKALGLPPAEPLNPHPGQPTDPRGGPNESAAHKRLKDYIAYHPRSIGLKKSLAPGETEYQLPSGDISDVLFQSAQCRIAVEVKSHISSKADLRRGLFQCVKYRAILKACRSLESGTYEVDALLAIEDSLPKELIPVKNTLGVKVIENVQIK